MIQSAVLSNAVRSAEAVGVSARPHAVYATTQMARRLWCAN